AVVEGHLQQELVVVGGAGLGPFDDPGDVVGQAGAAAEDAHPHPLALQPLQVAGHIGAHQPHQVRDLLGGTPPGLGREAEYGQAADAQRRRGLHRALQRLDALAVTHGARQAAGLRPAAIAVHDQGDMARPVRRGLGLWGLDGHDRRVSYGKTRRQTCMISTSLAFKASSMRLMAASVSFWTSVSIFFCSSWLISPAFSAFFRSSLASRRTLRTAIFCCSAYLPASLTRSLRRSSVSGGIGMRRV